MQKEAAMMNRTKDFIEVKSYGDIFPKKCGDRFFYGHTAGLSGDHDEQL